MVYLTGQEKLGRKQTVMSATTTQVQTAIRSYGRAVPVTGLGMADAALSPVQVATVAAATRGTLAALRRGDSEAAALVEALGRHDYPAREERAEIRRIVAAVYASEVCS